MLPLLLTEALSLLFAVGQAKEPVQIQASWEKLLGKWYINRWAGTIPLPKKKQREPLPPFSFEINYNGKLEFRMHILKPSGCQLFKLPFITTLSSSGIYSTWWKHLILIWMITPPTYGIAYFEDKMNNQDVKMMVLFGRTLDDNPDALWIFGEFVEKKGLNRTEVINPPHTEACELSRDP